MKKGRGAKSASMWRLRHKPGSVLLLAASSFIYATYPPRPDEPPFSLLAQTSLVYMVLLPARFTLPVIVAIDSGGLLHPLFTLTPIINYQGGLFSAALSVHCMLMQRPGLFTRCGTLCSPDFPPQLLGAMKSIISRQS